MSQENIELARHAMESAEAFFDLMDEYVVCDYREYRLPDAPEVQFGRQAVIDSARRFWGTFEDYTLEAEQLLDAGPSVVVVMREQGRGKGSGITLERHWAWLWTFRKGRLVRLEPFRSKEAALEAVGLRE
jgi:ketosteroid isomerase-like protein